MMLDKDRVVVFEQKFFNSQIGKTLKKETCKFSFNLQTIWGVGHGWPSDGSRNPKQPPSFTINGGKNFLLKKLPKPLLSKSWVVHYTVYPSPL